jgi:phosphate ABC transporter phosphate-binding protein
MHFGRFGRAAGASALAIAVLTTSSFAATTPTIPTTDVGTIAGIGATFPAPLYNEWFSQFKADNPSAIVSFTYAANGSGAGVTAIKNSATDYGASDAALSDADMTATSGIRGGVANIPMTIGGVVLGYHVNGVKSLSTGKVVTLKLNASLIGSIYAGKITWWDNSAIKKVNVGVKIPHTRIIPVRRTDSSGTTFVFQSYLKTTAIWQCILGVAGPQKAFSTTPQTCLGGKSIPGTSAPRNSGVAARVSSTNGTIGYMEYAYAITGGIRMARVKNASGIYMTPTTSSFSSAAAAGLGSVPADLRAAPIILKKGANSWPITSYSYLFAYKDLSFMGSLEKAQMFVAYLYWSLTTGQTFSRPMGYAPLPTATKTKALAVLHTLQYSGSAVWP